MITLTFGIGTADLHLTEIDASSLQAEYDIHGEAYILRDLRKVLQAYCSDQEERTRKALVMKFEALSVEDQEQVMKAINEKQPK